MDKGSLLLTIVSFPFNVCDIDFHNIVSMALFFL